MGGKKKQRTKWRTLPMAHPEAQPESYLVEQPRPARPPQSSHRQPPSAQPRRAPRLVSGGLLAVPVAAIPLVPSCPPAGSGVLFENGPDPEAKGCYVNGLWIPASELPRTQWLQLFLLLPRPCWATPGVATGAPPAAAAPPCPDAVAAAAAECQAYRDELGPTPPNVASPTTSCLVASEEQDYSLARTEPASTGNCDDRLRAMEGGTTEARNDDDDDPTNAAPPGGGLEDLVNRTLARCLEEARPEIVLQHRHRSRRWATSMAQQLLEQALVDARAEMEAKKHNDSTSRPSSSPTNVVDGEASRLAGEILSAAVSATAHTLREASHREERSTSDKRPPTGQLPQQQHDPSEVQQRHQQSPSAARRLLTSARDKAHFLADPATSPEPALQEVLGAGVSSTKKPSEPRCAEIVVHEMDDELSEAGSEDVELLGHRYETAAPRSSVRGESLATELRRCREPSPGDSGVQSQESGDEAAAKQASASSTARRWGTKLMAGFAPGTGSRICCSIV